MKVITDNENGKAIIYSIINSIGKKFSVQVSEKLKGTNLYVIFDGDDESAMRLMMNLEESAGSLNIADRDIVHSRLKSIFTDSDFFSCVRDLDGRMKIVVMKVENLSKLESDKTLMPITTIVAKLLLVFQENDIMKRMSKEEEIRIYNQVVFDLLSSTNNDVMIGGSVIDDKESSGQGMVTSDLYM